MADIDVTGLPASCKDAEAIGSKFYFTGKPCIRGHLTARYTSAHMCLGCQDDRLAFLREETQKREALKDPTPRKAAQLNGDVRYFTGKPCPRGHVSERLTSNGACLRCAAENAAAREAADPAVKTHRNEYREMNAERYRSHARNRKAILRDAEGAHTQRDIIQLIVKQKGRCAYCREELDGWHVDHIQPISKGGSNHKKNLQLTCRQCNLKKHNKDPIVFGQSLGRLL